jgi:DNA-binding CsgD family transcriptional regulator
MDEVQKSLVAAWNKIRPTLNRDPAELKRRLARRDRLALLAHPPRAWCLAVRATDTRLDRYCVSHPNQRADSHQLSLNPRALWKLCAPVFLDPPGMTIELAAKRLGTTRCGLLDARVGGVFQTHHVRGLGGYRGKPRPLLYARGPLDPAARNFAPPDPVWSVTAINLIDRIPPDLEQLLRRVPHFKPTGPNYNDVRDLHPEHPAREPPPRRRSRALPPPPPDYVWYKWKGDEYVGYDWRNPIAAANHLAREQRLARIRERQRQRRREHPPPSKSQGSLQFRGWRWLCPQCNRKVNLLYLPLPPLALLLPPLRPAEGRGEGPPNTGGRDPTAMNQFFACEKCHRLKRLSRCDPNSWNELITYLSNGLLFGREVPRPSWFPRVRRSFANRQSAIGNRKLPYTPRPRRDPSRRRPQIERMLLLGMTFRQIARDLNLVYGTVLWYAQRVYEQHGVRSLPELLRKHGITPKLKKRPEVRQRVLDGQSVDQIAREMGISAMCVYNHVYMLRRSGLLPSKRNQMDKHPVAADNSLR